MTIAGILGNAEAVIRQAVGLLFAVVTLVFLWGIIQYVIAGSSEDKIKQARSYIIYGLIGLFVMLSLWAIVGAVSETLFG